MKLPTNKNSFVPCCPCNNGSGDDNNNYNINNNDINIIIITSIIIMIIAIKKDIDFTVRRERAPRKDILVFSCLRVSENISFKTITTAIMSIINILHCVSSFQKYYIY